MPDFELLSRHQLALSLGIAGLLKLKFEVLFETFRDNREATILPVIPLEAIRASQIHFVELALFQFLALDG